MSYRRVMFNLEGFVQICGGDRTRGEGERIIPAADNAALIAAVAHDLGHVRRSGRTSVYIGTDVQADGRLGVVLWCGDKANALYALAPPQQVLQRNLPQAIEEAVALAQGEGYAG